MKCPYMGYRTLYGNKIYICKSSGVCEYKDATILGALCDKRYAEARARRAKERRAKQ